MEIRLTNDPTWKELEDDSLPQTSGMEDYIVFILLLFYSIQYYHYGVWVVSIYSHLII